MRSIVIVALAVISSCGSSPPPVTMYPPIATDHDRLILRASAARPSVDLATIYPDPTEEARWPLAMASHPVLEPHFKVAAALAQPGIGWLELCGRGVQNRHLAGGQDLVDYLKAWCSAANHDAADALFRLGKLQHSAVAGLAVAIKLDVVAIMIDHGSSDDAEGLLRRSNLADLEIVDILAASYFDVGRRDDAAAMNQLAIAMAYLPMDDVRCHRLVRAVVLAPESQRADAARMLHVEATNHVVADPTCAKLDNEVRCWLDSTTCDAYFRNKDPKQAALLTAVRDWPEGVADAGRWMHVVQSAMNAMPLEGAAQLAIVARELVLETSTCTADGIDAVRRVANDMRAGTTWPTTLDHRLDTLIAATEEIAVMPEPDCRRWLVGHSR